MKNQLLFLMYFLATTESFAGGSTGIGPPMKTSGMFDSGTSTIGPAGHSENCRLYEAQLVIESRGTKERLSLNPMVIARTSGGSGSGPLGKVSEVSGGSSGTGTIGNTAGFTAAIDPNSLSKLKFFAENNEDLVIKSENSWLEVQSINYFADPDQVEIVLESTTIKLMASEGGVAGSGPPAKRISAYNSFEGGAGGGTPTITEIDGGSTAGGGTFSDGGGVSPTITGGGLAAYGGTVIGTGSGGTRDECGISGGSGVISAEIGGSGVGGDGWNKDGGSMGGSTADVDGITVGGGTPYH